MLTTQKLGAQHGGHLTHHKQWSAVLNWPFSRYATSTAATARSLSPGVPQTNPPQPTQASQKIVVSRTAMSRRSRSGMGTSPQPPALPTVQHEAPAVVPPPIPAPQSQQLPRQQQQTLPVGPAVRRRSASHKQQVSFTPVPDTQHEAPQAVHAQAPYRVHQAASTVNEHGNSSSQGPIIGPGPALRRRSPVLYTAAGGLSTSAHAFSDVSNGPNRQRSPAHVEVNHQPSSAAPSRAATGRSGGVQGRVGLSPPLLTATDKLHHQITDPVNALTSIQAIMDFKKIKYSTLLSQLVTLYQEKRLSKEQLAALHDLSYEHAERGSGLSLEQVQSGLASLSSGLKGKAKRCAAALCWLKGTYEQAVAAQELRQPGITSMQVELVSALHALETTAVKHKVSTSPAADAEGVVLTADDWARPGMELLRPATASKVKAFLQGRSVADIVQMVKRKNGIKVGTVQQALVDALKAGVELPVDRLLQEFKLTGGESELSYEAVSKAATKLLPQQQDAPGLSWYFKVRSELAAEEAPTHEIVARQEAAIDEQQGKEGAGTGFTVMQVRVVAYLMRQQQHHHQGQGQDLTAPVGQEQGLQQEDEPLARRIHTARAPGMHRA